MPKTAVFTIASKNYLAYVRVLLSSVAKIHPEYELYLCLADKVDGYFRPEREGFQVIESETLGIPSFNDMVVRYDIMEFNTAVKPYMFTWLLQNTDVERVIYLDPDIRAYSRFDQVERLFDEGASIVLTPHIIQPLEDGKTPNDYHMLQAGVFNLGFIAARRCEESLLYMGWWGRRLATQAVADFGSNLFTDQRWCDLAPCFLDSLRVLKDPGYNVAYWNLAQRKISEDARDNWRANGRPLAFFHFSGVSADKSDMISKHQNRIQWSDVPECHALFKGYVDALKKAGWSETKHWPYAYSRTASGVEISSVIRALFRSVYPESRSISLSELDTELIRLCNQPEERLPIDDGGVITRLMYLIYCGRDDLKAVFDLNTQDGRRNFISWFAEAGPREYQLPRHLAAPVVDYSMQECDQTVAPYQATSAHASGAAVENEHHADKQEEDGGFDVRRRFELDAKCARLGCGVDELLSQDEDTFIRNTYLALLGRFPDAQGHAYYARRLTGGDHKLDVTYQIFRSPEARVRDASMAGRPRSALRGVLPLLPKRIRRRVIADVLERSLATYRPSTSTGCQVEENAERGALVASRLEFLDQPATVQPLLGERFISNLMYLIWRARPDLQQVFDLNTSEGQQGFAGWYESSAEREYGLEPEIPRYGEASSATPRLCAISGKPGANLIGYAHAELGMGEHVRMTAAALNHTDALFKVVNFNVGVASRQKASLDHGELTDGNPYKANIFHINADQMLLAYCRLGRNFFADRYNIGYWAWELAKCPEDWLPVLGMMNEVWAPSKFIQQAFAERTDLPVEYMPLCVALPPLKGYSRRHYGLPEDVFIFLYTFDFFSYLDRKNPFAAINAFKRAFLSKTDNVLLVLKIMNGDPESLLWTQMMELIGEDKRIVVMNRVMDRDEVIGLFSVSDCFVSLHRSEGFGRGPAEAMYLGKPVIVTNYSGNTDFTLPDNSCLVDYKLIPVEEGQYPFYQSQVWADPDVEHASWYMRKVFEDAGFRSGIGKRGKEFIHKNFSQSTIGSIYAERLRALGLG